MAKQNLENGATFGTQRAKINENFTEVYDDIANIELIPGPQGEPGIQGPKGDDGEKGQAGDRGLQGLPGADGADGVQGEVGLQGTKGDTGSQGIQGVKGDTGDSGILSFSTTGTTGPATYNTSTKALNIPNYTSIQAASLGYSDVTTLGIPSTAHTTDDKAIFQGILDQGYIKLYIPANCTINLSDTIYAYGNTDILGAGQSKSIIRALNWVGGTEHGLIEFNGVSNIRFESIKFTGNVVQMKAALVLNPFPNANKNVKIYNCVFQDLWSHGILFGSGDSTTQWYEQIDIAQNYFNKLYDPAHIIIPDEDSVNLKCVGVWLGSHTKKAMIHHNFFEDQSGDAVHAFGTTPPTGNVPLDPEWRRLDISHNYIYQTWMGIELNGNYGTANGSNISHNIIIQIRRPNGSGFGISFAGDHSKITDNIVVTTEMSGYEIFGNNNEFHNNQHRFSVFKNGSGGSAVPGFNDGSTSISNLEIYGSNVSIKNNVFNNDIYYDNGTVTTRQINGINVVGKSIDNISPPSFEGVSDFATNYDIQGNHIHGITKSFVEATINPIRKVHIWNNNFTSKNLLNSGIWIQGLDWDIHDNFFDLDGSVNGYNDGIGIIQVHNTVSDTRARIYNNKVRNDRFKIPPISAPFVKSWNNQYTNDANVTFIVDEFPKVTLAERLAISNVLSAGTTVRQTDGIPGIYEYDGTSWINKGVDDDYVKNITKAATTTNITLSGLQTIDGISLVSGDRILVKNQTTAANNGVYIVASGSWSRSGDTDTPTKLNGAVIPVMGGTVNSGSIYLQTNNIVTLGTTSVNFTQPIKTGTNLAQSGSTLSVSNAPTFTGRVTALDFRVSALQTAPATATSTGTLGEIRWTNGFVYLCVATNTWIRAALATW